MYLPEEIVMNIIARLPLQNIVRLKLVCREWKSFTLSAFFRDLYRRNSNSISCYNWSILHGNHIAVHSSLEEMKLDLPRESAHVNSSFESGFTQNKNNKIKEIRVVACTDGLVLLRLLEEEDMMMIRYYIGNPVLPQWIQLPDPPSLPNPRQNSYGFFDSGLVTRMHNGALLGYKVVRINRDALNLGYCPTWSFEIFSSDTGEWSVKQVSCLGLGLLMLNTSNSVSLNGKLHWLDNDDRIVVHDFFSHDDQARAIWLPAWMQGTRWNRAQPRCDTSLCPFPWGKMICTTSQGYFVVIDVGLIEAVKSYNVRIWRLKCDSWKWEKAWEMNMASVGLDRNCVPVAINCFDIDIIYLWDLDRKRYLTCNLRTLTKSYGTRKSGAAVYKEDTYCFEPMFEIKLEGFEAPAKIKIIKQVLSFTDLGLKEAKELVEKTPSVLKLGLSKEEGEKIVEELKAVGAKVVLE